MAKTEREALVDRFNKAKEAGLLDMKFFVGEVGESTVERVCQDVNNVLDMVDAKEYVELDSWEDSK